MVAAAQGKDRAAQGRAGCDGEISTRAVRYDHPGDPRRVMQAYRRHILGCPVARGQMHYHTYLQTYLAAKRLLETAAVMQRALAMPLHL